MGLVIALIALALLLGLLGAVISALKGLVVLALLVAGAGLLLGAVRGRRK